MAYLDGIDLDPGLFRDKAAAEPTKPRGMLRSVGDTALSFGQGAVQGVRMLTDLAGADNAASGGLRTAEQFLAELKSPQAQANRAEQARILKEAEDAGVLDQLLAGGRAFLTDPVQTIAQGVGTIVPTVAATMLTGGAGAAARLAAPAIVGGAQGVGNVKGQVYDAVKRQYLEDGATEAEADARAAEAQAYSGQNADQLALAGALGVVAGTTGAERALGMLRFGGKAAPGMTARVTRNAVMEAIPEFAQGAQEQVAQNVALQREGFDVPTARGVVGNATMEMLAGGAIGALTGIPKPREPVGAPALPVLAAANVDEAIAAMQQAVAPKAEAKPDNALAALRDTALAELGPLDRQEALRLLAAAENPQAGPGVRAFAKQRLTELLEPGAGLPGAEVTELDPADLIPTAETAELTSEQFDQMMLRRPTPSQRAAAAKGPLPVGEATELEPETIEDGGTIPVGDVIEAGGDVPRPEGMAERTPRADAVPVDRGMPNAVAAYVERMRGVNTPAARAFVQDFDAGRITPAEVADLIVPPKREPTPDERLARAAAQAPTVQPGDLVTVDGMPYGTSLAARVRAKKEGLPPTSVIEIPNAGYVVRPKETPSVNQPDVAAPAGMAAGARDVGAPDAGGGRGDVGRVPAGPGGVQPAAQAPVAGGAEAAPAGAGGQPDAALKPAADYPSLDSDDIPTLKRKWAEAVRAGRTGEATAINDRIVALKAKPAAAPAAPDYSTDPFTLPKDELNRRLDGLIKAGEAQDLVSGFVRLRQRYMEATGKPSIPPEGSRFVPMYPAGSEAAPAAPAPATSREVMPEGLFVQYQGKTFKVDSLEDAQRKWAQFRDVAAGGGPAGVSEVGNGVRVVDGAGRLVARVAYNGRLFDPNDQVMAEAPAPAAPAATERVEPVPAPAARASAATPPAKEGPTTQGATDGQELQGQGEGGRRQALTPAGEAAVPSGSSAAASPAPSPKPLVERVRERVERAKAGAAPATHQDPGEAPEAATKPVIAEALKTGALNEDKPIKDVKAEALRLIDQAIAKAPSSAEVDAQINVNPPNTIQGKKVMTGVRSFGEERSVLVEARETRDGKWTVTDESYDGSGTGRKRRTVLGELQGTPALAREQLMGMLRRLRADGTLGDPDTVTIAVPGDGEFKVVNTKERLAEFRKKVEASPGFKTQRPGPTEPLRVNGYGTRQNPGSAFGVEGGSGSARAAIEAMVDEGDAQAAVDYAAMKGLDLAEVLKGQPERLKKVAGLTPTAAEPEPKTLEDLITEFKDARAEAKRTAAGKVPMTEMVKASDAAAKARDALAGMLAATPDPDFALSAKTTDGRMLILNPSAQRPGQYQLTRFDREGEPWGDSQYTNKQNAVDEFLREVDVDTLRMGEAELKPAEAAAPPAPSAPPPQQAPEQEGDKPPQRFIAFNKSSSTRRWEVLGTGDDIVKLGEQNRYSYGAKYWDTEQKAWVKPGARGPVKDQRARPQYGEVPELDDIADPEQYTRTLEQMRERYAERDDDFTSTDAAEHEANVRAAVALGKPVPAAVLADYPDLKRQAPEQEGGEEAPATIQDVGEKIGGARKDTAVSGGTTGRKRSDDERPAWARRFQVSQIVAAPGQINGPKDEGRWIIRDTRNTDWTGQPKQVGRDTFATKEEADAFVPIAAVGLKHRAVATRGGKYEIWRDITDRKRVKVVDREFDTREDAMRYMAENAVAIIETNTTFGEADMPLPPDRARTGPARRTGNVTGQDFKDTFGFRGVEFGNWNNQDERQALMNDAWDGLMDLAEVLNIPPKAIGLNGDLALAFGARGHGLQSARAHYELERAVINLTKEKGAGSLAHEWFHALDHYFGRQDGKASATWTVNADGTRSLKVGDGGVDMASSGFTRNKSGVRPELRAAYEKLLGTMTRRAETYVEDVAKVDKFTGTTKEELAQALDSMRRDLSEQKDVRYWKRNNKPAPAEVLAEFDAIAKAMLDGDAAALSIDWRTLKTGDTGKVASRWTNDSLERLSAIYKQVRGRSGFDSTNRQGIMDRLRGYMERYSQRLKMLAEAQSGAEKQRMVPTEFAMNARELDQGRGSDYWTTPHEMAARAFQGYVEDKIAERGGKSRFLNYGPENAGILTPWGFKRPFPAGEERKAINQAFDRFIGEIKTRDTDAGGVEMFSLADDPTWYSELARKIETAGMNAAQASGWKQMLAGLPSKGVKRDEIEWSGLPEWLDMQTGKVTKQAVLDYLRTNGVRVQEVVLGDGTPDDADVALWWNDEGGANEETPFEELDAAGRAEAVARYADEVAPYDEGSPVTKYSQYTLPGGTNYREVLLTLPAVPRNDRPQPLTALPTGYEVIFDSQEPRGQQWGIVPPGQMHARPWAGRHADPDAARAAALAKLNAETLAKWRDAAPEYKSGHWDQPNILAHIRVNDRTDAEGKRVLFVEELQSDWSQAGHKKTGNKLPDGSDERVGFRRPFSGKVPTVRGEQMTVGEFVSRDPDGQEWLDRQNAVRADLNDPPLADTDPVQVIYEDGKITRATTRIRGPVQQWAQQIANDWARIRQQERQKWAEQQASKPPAGPFVDSTDKWVALALKRVIKMAVDEGYDRVAFVTGEQSAERYDLSKQIDAISYVQKEGGTFNVEVMPKGRRAEWDRTMIPQGITADRLADYVGKEVADKIQRGEGRQEFGGRRMLSGLDLKVGGEGMRAFYDKIVPTVAKEVLRKLGGGSMERLSIGGVTDGLLNEIAAEEYDGSKFNDLSDRAMALVRFLAEKRAKKAATAQPGFDITPAMRERAAGGVPMFDVKGWGTVDGGAFPVDIADYAQADLADRAAVRRLQDAIVARGVAGLRLDALPARAGAPAGQPLRGTDRDRVAVAQLARRVFDKRATFFTSNIPVANGVVSSAQPDRIFLRFDMDKPHLAVFGHELLHSMRQDRPDLYDTLAERLRAITVGRAERDERLQQKYDRLGLPRLSADKVEEEFIADVVGDNFTDPEFWRALGRGQPAGFRRVLDAVMKWLDDVVERITRIRPLGTDQYLTDLNAAREAVADAMRNYSAGEVGTVADEAVSFAVADPTDSPAFKRWFGDSKVVDAEGKPLVVYHGTASDFSAFDPQAEPGTWEKDRGLQFFTSSPADASAYAESAGAGANVMPVYLAIRNPRLESVGGDPSVWWDEQPSSKWELDVEDRGHDGLIVRGDGGRTLYVTRRPDQIKSAIGNRGTFDPADPNIMFSLAEAGPGPAQRRPMQQMVRNTLADMLGSAGARVSWWEKSIGTQYAKAEKHPEFKRVFDIAQQYLEDTSTLANEAADLAGGILPKMETWQDWKRAGGLKDADAKALAAPIFEGTLTDKRVYDDAELSSRFGLNPEQIALYRQFLRAVNTSLDQAVTADVLRMVGDKNPALREMAITDRQGFRDGVTDYLREQIAKGVDADSNLILLTKIEEKYERIEQLKEEGYAPLMRFGKYKVHVVDQDGGTLFFGLYETGPDANNKARQLAADPQFADAKVEQGTISQEAYRLFSQVPLDSLELFAEAIGASESEVFQEFIKVARNNRSALKRLIKRNGTAGFSEDVPRVLASFVMSNARMAAGAMNMPSAKEAAAEIRAGDVQDEAVKLLDTIQNPKETAGAIRGLMFVNFIGGSIASAVVNLTQPVTMTLPYLSQWGGGVKAAARLMAAGKAAASGRVADPDMRAALARAEAKGIVSPQEIHHLRAQASNSWGDKPWLRRLGFVWAAPFSLAEQFNRRITFLAAYRTAKEEGLADPFDFAEKAVLETQGLYNKANAPNWARNPVGAVALTFKQFSIHYIEWMSRLWKSGPEGKRAVGLALALLVVAAGTDGLPFADDLDDLIDTLGQALGYDMNAKKARREFVAETLGLGDEVADVIARGFSAMPGVPMDTSIRMSMGNMLPGSGLFLRSNTDRSRELLEFAGPGGSLAKQYMDAGQAALRGDMAGAVGTAVPIALQNVAKAMTMWETGEARDQLGRKVMDVDATDGLMRFLGFNPQALARESEKITMIRRSEQLAKNVEGEIAADWARATVDGDQEGVAAARQRLLDWNERNPEQPIVITPKQILARAKKLRQERLQRFVTSVSPERRARVEEALQQ